MPAKKYPLDDIRTKVALSRRMLARNGCDSNVGGHVSARAPGEDAFWITPLQYFDQTIPEDCVKVGFDMEQRDGTRKAPNAGSFHAAIYQARPDVASVIHLHSPWITIAGTMGKPLGIYSHESSFFFQDQAMYEEDGVRPPVYGPALAEALGSKRVILIKNHGSITASESLERCTVESIALEKAAHYHVEAARVGGKEMGVAETIIIKKNYIKHFVPLMWEANVERLRRSDPDLFAHIA